MQTPFSISWQFLKARPRLPSPTPLVGAVDNPTSTQLVDPIYGGPSNRRKEFHPSLFGTGEEEKNKIRAIQQGSQSMIGDLDEEHTLTPEQLQALSMLPPRTKGEIDRQIESYGPSGQEMTYGDYASMGGN